MSNSKSTKEFLKETGLFLLDILYNAIIIVVLVILIRSFLISPFRVIGSSMVDTLASHEFILINKLSYHLSEPKLGDPIVFRPPVSDKDSFKFDGLKTVTDSQGTGSINIDGLKTTHKAAYCNNAFMKLFWFCHNVVQEGDLVYYRPASDSSTTINWKNASKIAVSENDVLTNSITFNALPNREYVVRIFDKAGPEYFVKRIIGVPGDTIKIENGKVYRKSPSDSSFKELSESYLNGDNSNQTYITTKQSVNQFTVPEEAYFVMGDNRKHSNDSRGWFAPIDQERTPFVSREMISGKVLIVLWPLNSIRLISP